MAIEDIMGRLTSIDLRERHAVSRYLLFADGGPDATTPELQRLAVYLQGAPLEEFGDLWELFKSCKKEDIPRQQQVFGQDYMARHGGRRLVGTMTPDYGQFRIWDGAPGHMREDHVDSGGLGLVLHCTGPRDFTERVQKITFPQPGVIPVVTPIGVTLY